MESELDFGCGRKVFSENFPFKKNSDWDQCVERTKKEATLTRVLDLFFK